MSFELTERVLEQARRVGAEDAEVFLQESTHFSTRVRQGTIETLTEATSRALHLRVFVEQRVARRSRILLLAHEKESRSEIARKLGCGRNTVWRICERFRAEGLDGALEDRPHPGAPRRISPPRPHPDSSSGLRAAR